MNRRQRAALLVDLAVKLREGGSWCGETHLQKAVYFFQELLDVPTGFDFMLYKHGPFSFDLRDELTAMRADGLLELKLMPFPYGPSLVPTREGRELLDGFPKTLKRYEDELNFVAENLGKRRVTELERLATALYVTNEGEAPATVEDRALRMRELKPHISLEESEYAVGALDEIISKGLK